MSKGQGRNTDACSADSERPLSSVAGKEVRDRYILPALAHEYFPCRAWMMLKKNTTGMRRWDETK